MDNYFDLGSYSRTISTNSAEAQCWFDRGLNWCYAFHQEEAVRCFHNVIKHDQECAMGYWGVAYATGPNYNLPWEYFSPNRLIRIVARTHAYTQQALNRLCNASPVEQALIRSLSRRYQAAVDVDRCEFSRWVDEYALAMRWVFADFSNDYDVCCLTADALMSRTPWLLWDLKRNIPTDNADTLEAIAILEHALGQIERNADAPHPGLLHYYIHALEMSPFPEKALLASHRLRYLAPEAGHLLHMPSHIYVLCGHYDLALDANTDAIEADRKYASYHPEIGIFAISRCHNYHFRIHAAMMLGQWEPAIQSAEELRQIIPLEGIYHEQDFLAHTLEGYYAVKIHALVRFGRWEMIIEEPLPEDQATFLFTTALTHYAKAIAHAALGNHAAAAQAQQQFEWARWRIPRTRRIFNNNCHDILRVARHMMMGEVAYHAGDYTMAFDCLREAVALYDALAYTEPWSWMHPIRHALGALLLAQGHVEEAMDVYRADLGLDDTVVRPSQHPDNVWSLQGYAECLERLGSQTELEEIRPKLEKALALADTDISSSCFCRSAPTSCCSS